MSAPVTTIPVISDRPARRGVEPQARRRAADRTPYGQTRGRGARTSAAVAASLAEWGY